MKLGIVTNCWKTQLQSGTSLSELIEQARNRDYHVFELRQGACGHYENRDSLYPLEDRLTELPQQFPDCRFNIALGLPFLSSRIVEFDALLSAGCRAACSLSGNHEPHLRLVDLHTPTSELESQGSPVGPLLQLIASLTANQGFVSIENAKQSWSLFYRCFQTIRRQVSDKQGTIQLCYDPCNLLMASDHPDPQHVTEQLLASELAMVHFKQAQKGHPVATVASGDIDWPHQLKTLLGKGFSGPGLLEIPPGEDIWSRLDQSRDYIEAILGKA